MNERSSPVGRVNGSFPPQLSSISEPRCDFSGPEIVPDPSRSPTRIGQPDEVFTTERLMQAYGGHMRLVQTEDGLAVLSDTCCGEGHHSE